MEQEIIEQTAMKIMNVLICRLTIMMFWGANNFKAVEFNDMASLAFTVNGFNHKGLVVVAYNSGKDLYEVFCLDSSDRVVEHREEVYFDMLTDTIFHPWKQSNSLQLNTKALFVNDLQGFSPFPGGAGKSIKKQVRKYLFVTNFGGS